MTMKTLIAIAIVGLGATGCAASNARDTASDVAAGQAIYTANCALCHDNSNHMLNDNGPALFGVVGRTVGSVEGYAYSPALKAANVKGEVWREDRLDEFLKEPYVMHPGTSMPMNFADPKTRHAIIAYLKTLK